MGTDIFLNYAAPPLLGAFIGYATNYVAIRMLFRPLRSWRVMGIRIPFTPGIIPARRHELAATMGRTVGKHLVTAEDAAKALEKETVQSELRGIVGEKVAELLSTDYGTVASMLRPEEQRWLKDVIELTTAFLSRAAADYLESADFESRLRGLVREQRQEWLSRSLDDILSADTREGFLSHIRTRMPEVLASREVDAVMEDFLNRKLDDALASDRRLADLLPAELKDVLAMFIERELPSFLERVSARLQDADVRDRLVVRLEGMIADLPRSLGGVTGFLAGFVNTDRIKARLPEFLDEASREVAVWLSDEQTRADIAEQIQDRVDEWLQHSPADLTERMADDHITGIREFVQAEARRMLRKPATADVAAAAFDTVVRRVRNRPLAMLLEQALPPDRLEAVEHEAVNTILRVARGTKTRQAITDIVRQQLTHFCYEHRVGKVGDKIPDHVRQALPDLAYAQGMEILRRELPALVASLNVEQMVEDNINSLPILEVEGMLLAIMRKQFVYINLFGALLGFLIGCLNILW